MVPPSEHFEGLFSPGSTSESVRALVGRFIDGHDVEPDGDVFDIIPIEVVRVTPKLYALTPVPVSTGAFWSICGPATAPVAAHGTAVECRDYSTTSEKPGDGRSITAKSHCLPEVSLCFYPQERSRDRAVRPV